MKKFIAIIISVTAALACCFVLTGCIFGSVATFELDKEHSEVLGAGTKIEQKVGSVTVTYYMNAKIYSFEIKKSGTYRIIVNGPAADSASEPLNDLISGKIKVAKLEGALKKDDAKGLSTAIIINAEKEPASKDAEKYSDYQKKFLSCASNLYALDPGEYVFIVSTTNSNDTDVEYTVEIKTETIEEDQTEAAQQ